MSELQDFRRLVEQARQVGRMPIDAGESRDAVAAVQRRLGVARKPRRRRMVLIMSGSLAAAALIAIGLLLMPPRKVDAAEVLQNAADATQGFRGWVHVTPVAQVGVLSMLKPRVQSIHINTVDGSFAAVANIYGTLLVEMVSPTAHEGRMYTALSGTIVVSTVQGDAGAAAKRGADFPLRLADFLRQFKTRGLAAPKVVESTEQGLQRFDLTLGDNAKKASDQYPEMPDGKLTLWVDPQTKLIRKITEQIDGQPALMEYAYGAQEIHDIYDLGVPKTAQVVDTRRTRDEKRPAVFDLPATEQLVKDNSIDMKALAARLQKRSEADWGDFVSVECSEIKYLDGGGHSQGDLTIAGRQGEKSLYIIYLLSPEMVLFGGQGFPKGWPTPKLEDVVAQLRTALPIRVDAFDGKNGWHGEQATNALSSVQIKPTTRPAATGLAKINGIFWPSLRSRPAVLGTSSAEVLRDPARPGLIVLHLESNMPFALYKGTTHYQSDALYWLDPNRDDLPVEMVSRSNSAGGDKLDSVMHDVYLEFGRLADGRWYPSRSQYHGFSPPPTRPVKDDGYTEYRRQIFQDAKLSPDWYGDPNLRITDSGPHFPATEPAR